MLATLGPLMVLVGIVALCLLIPSKTRTVAKQLNGPVWVSVLVLAIAAATFPAEPGATSVGAIVTPQGTSSGTPYQAAAPTASTTPPSQPSPSPPTQPPAGTTSAVPKSTTQGDCTGARHCVIFDNIARTREACSSTYTCAPSGKDYFVIRVTLKNSGKSTESVNPFYFSLSASDGVKRDHDSATYGRDSPMESADILPGGSLTGDLVFLLPVAAYPTEFCFKNYDTDHCAQFTY